MKVICINNGEIDDISTKDDRLTQGKIYECNHIDENNGMTFFYITDDRNIEAGYLSFRFITLQKFRKQKLNKILK